MRTLQWQIRHDEDIDGERASERERELCCAAEIPERESNAKNSSRKGAAAIANRFLLRVDSSDVVSTRLTNLIFIVRHIGRMQSLVGHVVPRSRGPRTRSNSRRECERMDTESNIGKYSMSMRTEKAFIDCLRYFKRISLVQFRQRDNSCWQCKLEKKRKKKTSAK